VAVRLANGEKRWFNSFGTTADKRGNNAAATSVIPGVVFNGGTDGLLHAVASEDGKNLWQFDTAREFDTVDKVPARGGSMAAPGPVVSDGMVFVSSGYAVLGDVKPGNVLLAFSAQ
jgi:polyvinyl alcohol dehydrogenase (cytochrome)